MLGTIYILTWNFAEMKNMAYISFGFVRWILFGKISGLPKRLTGSILDINFCIYSVEQWYWILHRYHGNQGHIN